MMKEDDKRRVIYKSPKHGYEIIVDSRSSEERAKEYDRHLDQSFPAISNIPKCSRCDSDKVANIFYGSTPSGGHTSGKPLPPDYHPCRDFAKALKARNRIIALDAHIDYKDTIRPMWHCCDCEHNFDN